MGFYKLADPGGLDVFLSLGSFLDLSLDYVHISMSNRTYYPAICMMALLYKAGTSLGKEEG